MTTVERLQARAAQLGVTVELDRGAGTVGINAPTNHVFGGTDLHWVDAYYGGDGYPHATEAAAARYLLAEFLDVPIEPCETYDCDVCADDADDADDAEGES